MALRFGLQREVKKFRPDINIVDDVLFQSSSEVFKAVCVQLKKIALAKVNHKPPISKSDLQLLYSSGVFSTVNPVSLQKKVFFEVMLYLCRRGRENLRLLEKDSFKLKEFPDGRKYIINTKDEMTKNLRVNDDYVEGGYIVETGGENCPVMSFLLYLSKLNPRSSAFFQRPKGNIPTSGPWFDNMVLGVKTLEKLMKKISVEANLSEIYTNHSIRATCITVLDSAGIEARHIMSVSGHKSETSIRSYATTSSGMKRKIAQTISAYGSVEKPTFNFGVNLDIEDNDEAPSKVVIKDVNKAIAINDVNNATSSIHTLTLSSEYIPEERPHCSNNPMTAVINNCSGEPYFHNCYFNF